LEALDRDFEYTYSTSFGLSYSTFSYSDLDAKRTRNSAEIRVTIKNTSGQDGDEVVQLYIASGSEEEELIRGLRGFQRIRLRAVESREVRFVLDSENLPKMAVKISIGGGQLLDSIPNVQGTL
jgi:beta-glucosidase